MYSYTYTYTYTHICIYIFIKSEREGEKDVYRGLAGGGVHSLPRGVEEREFDREGMEKRVKWCGRAPDGRELLVPPMHQHLHHHLHSQVGGGAL